MREHNLKNIDVRIPLKRLVCVTGVSGSGKSTLVEDVLYPALLQVPGQADAKRRASSTRCDGAELVDDVVMVDQSPDRPHHALEPGELCRRVRRDPRAVRQRAGREGAQATPPGTFSFNSGNGRCPTCGGNGFEHVEMQFLSDVYLRCPDCNGRRYRDEVLEIKREGADGARASIADVLDMTVTEALAFFADSREVAVRLAAARGRGPRVREARPAGADAVRRRGAAAEARRASRRGRRGRIEHHASTASCSCSTSRPPACTSRTSPSCCARSASCSRPAIRCWSSSTTST